MSAEVERELLNHYKLDSLYPSEWPDRDDDDYDSDAATDATSANHRESKFAALDRTLSAGGKRSDNSVQKDEPDPLGIVPSVVHELRRRGLPVEENLRLRNRFMLSSTTFSPNLFLSQVHHSASTDSLLNGLDFLSRSIEQKSASLKLLVESNFERFVKAKATIDNVYTEMRTQGQQAMPVSPGHQRRHSRHTSRGGISHFRTPSGALTPTVINKLPDKKKNALTKESEYGVLGIKAPLIELGAKAEEVWGPALGGREKEEDLKSVLSYVEQNRDVFGIGQALQDAIRKKDYDSLVSEYNRAKKLANDATRKAETSQELSDSDVHQILVAAKVWSDAQSQIGAFKRESRKQLSAARTRRSTPSTAGQPDTTMTLIATLLQIDMDDNPITFWLFSRYNNLKEKLTRSFDRMRIEIEVSRRRLASAEPPTLQTSKLHLQSAVANFVQDRNSNNEPNAMDASKIIDFWEKVQSALNSLLSSQGGLLSEIVEFWETAESFISHKAQRNLPTGVFSSEGGRQHLDLREDEISRLRHSATDLLNSMRENVFSFFVDSPVEDISSLFSPVPATPDTPSSSLASDQRMFSFDVNNIPEPSPKRGESWEKFAFWAPYANSLSGVHYLSNILLLVGTSAGEVASLSLVRDNYRMAEQLKTMVSGVRERCIQAVCAAWNVDSDKTRYLEDWSRHSDRRDLTNMPYRFSAFEETILGDMQKILYISGAMSRPGYEDVVGPPPTKLLQMVRHQFITSIYKTLSGAVENAEKNKKLEESGIVDPDGLTVPIAQGGLGADNNVLTTRATDKVCQTMHAAILSMPNSAFQNVRLLLTLSNLNHLRREVVPQLISQFESSFSIKFTDESKQIRDVLKQIDDRLFQGYVKPTTTQLREIISAGISSPNWLPKTSSRPTNARPYIYDVLLALVLVHTEVSTTASTLTSPLLSHFLESASESLLAAFSERRTYSLTALMQATLDVELLAQTLSNYTTEKASDIQSRIYLVLDERTDADARTRLQAELPEMRAILKRLREGTKGQFGCFRRERRVRSERPGSSRSGGTAGHGSVVG
ncbi:exocyst complex component Sec5 [Aureobasidium pullulans]|uniref:Exocyst complex component SEC5 n=1 Tax=Aureobasidium pullulans TaxID=5580 RepID=A0A4T0CQS0_AURPU|nr:exocyst complex component Sec5 [Aureobasidium pullulans]THW63771.1 exocyst complex component Sec5 [Aureobasidium pullulans]THX36857.1 exocyst complex component Sec5 [Aureobasidium pullulans]THX79167.1 exocyst complex component Sec5 [Aureobasidium pullulans]THY19242.1 exocyst complex component Sec5 [Aureobasidium pullulans]